MLVSISSWCVAFVYIRPASHVPFYMKPGQHDAMRMLATLLTRSGYPYVAIRGCSVTSKWHHSQSDLHKNISLGHNVIKQALLARIGIDVVKGVYVGLFEDIVEL